MTDAAVLPVLVGWALAPTVMILTALGWQGATVFTRASGRRRPSGRRRLFARRRCASEQRRLRELFVRYVGEDVVSRALEHGGEMGGQERDVAVLFVDLVGSTALVGAQRPGEVVALLNEFFRIVVDVVNRHGGFVNKFEGDAALAVFGAPRSHQDGAGAALTAARELRDELVGALRCTGFGIGVSAGLAFAGDVGARERLEYTVIGDPVNEAARLSELAKSQVGRVVASERTVRTALDAEGLRWNIGELVELRGRTTATRVARPAVHLGTRAVEMSA
jgi:adenylate cyclase